MGLIVATINHFSFAMQQPIWIGWDRIVAFNKLLHEVNYFNSFINGHENMSHMTCLDVS